MVESLGKRCGGFLKRLSLRGCRNVTDQALVQFAQLCTNIEELNVEECRQLSDSTCIALGSNCHRLRRLRLASCTRMTNISLHALASGRCGAHLEHLDISWCDQITDDGFAVLSRSCPRLRVLIAKGVRGMSDAAANALASSCPDLEVRR